jgi:hypothetical protein
VWSANVKQTPVLPPARDAQSEIRVDKKTFSSLEVVLSPGATSTKQELTLFLEVGRNDEDDPIIRPKVSPEDNLPRLLTAYMPIIVSVPLKEIRSIENPTNPSEYWPYMTNGKIAEITATLLCYLPDLIPKVNSLLTPLFPSSSLVPKPTVQAGFVDLYVVEHTHSIEFCKKGSGFQAAVVMLTMICFVQLHEPGVPLLLLLDEPTAYLHESVALDVVTLLRSLDGVQVVIASHSMKWLETADVREIIPLSAAIDQEPYNKRNSS